MIILLYINLVFASEWTTTEFYPSTWGSRKICEQLGKGKECFEILESSARYAAKVIQVDDESKPLYEAASNEKSCFSLQDCANKMTNLCVLPRIAYINETMTKVYCSKVVGYQKKDKSILALDSNLDLAYQSEKQTKAVEAVKEQMVQAKLADIQKGQKIIAIMRVGSDSKNLTKQQKKALITATKEVIEALNVGSLDVAKDLIEAITPDGTLITNEDKTKILGLL